jgi:TM2 domain-containing membrane protein YozV
LAEKSDHSLIIGYLLWIFGFTGAHRFYFGKPISGTIWFFTFGLFGIGWLIDVFLIPFMASGAKQRYYDGDVSYNVSWILLTFLGPFGAHRLYMGKILTAVLWFFTGGLFMLGVLYDYWTLNEQVSVANRKH